MEKLIPLVARLESLTDIPAQLALLQRLTDTLLQSYCFDLGDRLLYPLWLEAYYFHPGKFEDENAHRAPVQQNHFGQLYFHRKGYGGVDICLSRGAYCLSFLIKYSCTDQDFFSQVALFRYLNPRRKTGEDLENRPLLRPVPASHHDGRPVLHSPRKGLVKESFRREMLASLKGVDDYPFHYEKGFGKRRLKEQLAKRQAGERQADERKTG